MKVQNYFRLHTVIVPVITGILWLVLLIASFPFGISGPLTVLALGALSLFTYFAVRHFNCWISSIDINKNNYFGL